MAEAHSAVAFSFSVTHEGVRVNYDREVLHLIWLSGVRAWRKRLTRILNNVRCGIYPGSLKGLGVSVAALSSVYYAGYDPTYGLIPWMQTQLPETWVATVGEGLSCTLVGVGIWSTAIFTVRNFLRFLFNYKGWMYEQRGKGRKISLWTKLWITAVKVLSGWNKPMLYSFQGSLPSLPLPKVHDTMQRYLSFKILVGHELYAILVHPTTIQAARAANITYGCLLFRRAIERQELEPIMVQGLVPLCSWQYERVFNTTRVPGEETDRIQHMNDSLHIAVYCRGKYFRMPIHHKGRLLKPAELQVQFQRILDDQTVPEKGEEKLAALTAWERTGWAQAREKYFLKGINRTSLDIIEKSAFVVVLDNEEYFYDPKDTSKLDNFARRMLHGQGYDRWFDKSFNIVVGANGRVGFNSEHSWADAPIMGHLWEFCIAEEFILGYDDNGNTQGSVEIEPPSPIRLKWEMPPECLETIEYSSQSALALLNDVDLKLYVHDHYGKGFMKTCRASPDAYIQMALQLAYYRDAGKFNLTYEASMTRLFREGRTETVRPCTIESCEWVKSMENQSSTKEERIKLLQKACGRHQLGYQDAMCGKGIDRHLFCLYVVSKYLEVDSPFLKEVLSEPWRLSTSQTPHGQTTKLDLKAHPDCISAGGGFGPVADDGYGVSYIIAGEDVLFFHISSKKSSPETDSVKFAGQIERALRDMKDLFTKPAAANGVEKSKEKALGGDVSIADYQKGFKTFRKIIISPLKFQYLENCPPMKNNITWKFLICLGGYIFALSNADIPDHFYRLPLVGTTRAGREERTSTLLEPVNSQVQDSPTEHEGMCEGACISSRACNYYGGRPRGACINGNVCCKFERTCDGISREKISFFTSPDYPKLSNDRVQCSHLIFPNEDVCALRIDFLELNISQGVKFAGNFHKCIQDNIFVLNVLNGPHESLCEFQNYSALFSVDWKNPKPVTLLFVIQSQVFRWRVRVTQLNCKKLQSWRNDLGCGRQLLYEPEGSHSKDDLLLDTVPHGDYKEISSPLIVNGAPADQREFPWQASLQAKSKHRCGASILNENFLLTAAHCFTARVYEPPENLRVVVGDLVLDSDEDGGQPQILEVESIIVDYDYKSFRAHLNDIAVIKVKTKIKFNAGVQPVCLPTIDTPMSQTEALVSGWGRLNATYSPANGRLQKLQMRIIPNKECKQMHQKEVAKASKMNSTDIANLPGSRFMGNDNTHICAIADTNSTVCFGDSGGPLVIQSQLDGRFTQVGIVSFGLRACDVSNLSPVAFTRVSEFLQFITLATTSV
ncbi:unnamed protein product [Allacma fusca]|uniref:carnitine O-palmitoyltransferase n=1 Tax=Allacma fusca TaxID=39272 RepID=A0A8J2JNT7_9HEXA|nr:unnamed protein product [Allacma fusca]